ncbi:S-ribosylhomocysteine lyase [Fusibacter paucivorans]|uniref:S-ribosylhomocysteine lyase n=1 Tax=Fusibacter paucivorans TaxID=76009 RepID=A0ABS5PQI5_9FIRM|nr:S-ribosylhomocysteine lyase [Fusibacter paucivorans]MBS7526669.1 S-ribosylhomocysteine lyase [Fusibacter paucivorans]
MKKIESFEVDHNRLQKGVYVSRRDQFKDVILTTFDIRMKMPNAEALENGSIHTLEHLLATYFRNDETFGKRIVYFGPMGCLTGMYLILEGELTSEDVLPLLTGGFDFVAQYTGDIPGVSAIECGNYKLHDLAGAKQEALNYLNVLKNITEEQLNYPS